MRRGRTLARASGTGAATVALLAVAVLTSPGAALGAKLVGGREQAAIHRAFFAAPSHKGQLIVSIRASTVSPAWAIVKSVVPEGSGRGSARAKHVRLRSSFYHRVGGGRERSGDPPANARADLLRDFQVAVVYAGSGGETIDYAQLYRSVCAGAGGFTDQQHSTISPMSWQVRYVVDLDDVLSAVRSSDGITIVPSISFSGGASTLSAVQTLTRTTVDAGCIGRPTNFKCTKTYRLGGPDRSGMLQFEPGLGTEVRIPLTATGVGACDPDDYTLGPSLWDSGATAALVPRLNPLGGSLPANPYAPVSVSWPGGSAQRAEGFVTSPCQGDSACTDKFHWRGRVTLQAVS